MGVLTGLCVVELAGIGPGPFCAMMLADHGANVIRVERPHVPGAIAPREMTRNRTSISVDLKDPKGVEVVLKLVDNADILIEGFRPGTAERLGVGPETCLRRNPKLVYGRITGWGQEGPISRSAGHDINYVALTGLLHAIGRPDERPVNPINLLGDFGGGGLLLAFGVIAAAFRAHITGEGQVVDAAIVDGAALLGTSLYEMLAREQWIDRRGSNLLDGGAPFYDTYETADGAALAVGPLEPKFFAEFLEVLGVDPAVHGLQGDRSRWPIIRQIVADTLRSRTRTEWMREFEGTDACVTPVLSMHEAIDHPYNRMRNVFVDIGGVTQPAPAPRFARTPSDAPRAGVAPGSDNTVAILAELGYDEESIGELIGTRIVE